jgi:excisionase family DNA binding protein
MRQTPKATAKRPKPARATMTVPEFAALFGLSSNTVYKGIKLGQIPAAKFGKRTLIAIAVAQRLLAQAGATVE